MLRSWGLWQTSKVQTYPSDGCFAIIRDMDYSKIIRIEPGKRSGKPNIRGTRMTVTDVLEYLASGMTEEEILADFPDLTSEDIKACLAFAADRERKLATLPEHETAI